ncbi:hypothetical protein QBC46DRAFT_130474 [Diplogelasinospora grovesii]|uniref:Uncharacterized protein n=1 Tax=Diplogelasinospora grovesii TaxID=303347 RepID=A0AAN6N9F3_9PEZI|nr:hypothetical protein QBC46DRAFT_130474 [Diplogelasinospora grovesii]
MRPPCRRRRSQSPCERYVETRERRRRERAQLPDEIPPAFQTQSSLKVASLYSRAPAAPESGSSNWEAYLKSCSQSPDAPAASTPASQSSDGSDSSPDSECETDRKPRRNALWRPNFVSFSSFAPKTDIFSSTHPNDPRPIPGMRGFAPCLLTTQPDPGSWQSLNRLYQPMVPGDVPELGGRPDRYDRYAWQRCYRSKEIERGAAPAPTEITTSKTTNKTTSQKPTGQAPIRTTTSKAASQNLKPTSQAPIWAMNQAQTASQNCVRENYQPPVKTKSRPRPVIATKNRFSALSFE